MARSFTLSELHTRARYASDMVGNPFIEEAELTQYINDSITELYDLLVGAYGEEYYLTEVTGQATGLTDAYDLPVDFYKLAGVDSNLGASSTSDYVPMRKYNLRDRNNGNLNPSSGWAVKYRIRGNKIVFTPPNSSFTYRLLYIPCATALVDMTDSFDGINGWEEYVVVDAAIKMLQKEESDTSELYRRKRDLMSRIEAMAVNRDTGECDTITDVSSDRYY